MSENLNFYFYGFPLDGDVEKVVDLGYRPTVVYAIYRKAKHETEEVRPIHIINTSTPGMPPFFRPLLGDPVPSKGKVKFYVGTSALTGTPCIGDTGDEKVLTLKSPRIEQRLIFSAK